MAFNWKTSAPAEGEAAKILVGGTRGKGEKMPPTRVEFFLRRTSAIHDLADETDKILTQIEKVPCRDALWNSVFLSLSYTAVRASSYSKRACAYRAA